jgi:TetR/AcrR family transcriptional repressor of nem operon
MASPFLYDDRHTIAMPLSKQHKAATRDRILAASGRLFRRDGAAQASVGTVMAEAGLTHGGFYAHFASKQALLAEVMTHDHGFIRHLARRKPGSPAAWWRQTCKVFHDYLEPAHLGEVALGCSFAALTGDAARSGEPVRAGYRQAWQRLVGEVLRGPLEDPLAAYRDAPAARREAAGALVGLAIGAVAIARVLEPDATAAQLLRGARVQALRQLEALMPPPAAARPASRPPTAARTTRTAARSAKDP